MYHIVSLNVSLVNKIHALGLHLVPPSAQGIIYLVFLPLSAALVHEFMQLYAQSISSQELELQTAM